MLRKRSGVFEKADETKLTSRLTRLASGFRSYTEEAPSLYPLNIDEAIISSAARESLGKLPDAQLDSAELDAILAQTLAANAVLYPELDTLAARVTTNALHKRTPWAFSHTVHRLSGILSPAFVAAVVANADAYDAMVNDSRDFDYGYFGLSTLMRQKYLLRDSDGETVERPQHLHMRVAVGLWGGNLERVRATYEALSQGLYTHATPTMFNIGTKRQQLSSCFLLAMQEDSIEGIYGTLTDVARISKDAGGIGVHMHEMRAAGSLIKSTNCECTGLIPMLRVYNETGKYVNQGGKRPGSIAVYLEPWHADVLDFLAMRRNRGGSEDRKCRDLFQAMWIPDLFMQRVETDGDWSLFCPSDAQGLADALGDDFKALYERYEAEGKARKTLKAQDLWREICTSQIETGMPYMLSKEANQLTNQQHLGTIRSGNLCAEAIMYTAPDETAVCNLASVALPRFVRDGAFDFEAFQATVKLAIRNLDRVIDINQYPTEKAAMSNRKHRPIGLGVQGLADVYMALRVPFDSKEAMQLNKRIFEYMYYASLEASCDMAEELGRFESFEGCPVSRGKLNFDLTRVKGVVPELNWKPLRYRAQVIGMRNSLLLALMPTASTAQILGNSECFEPYASNVFVRRTNAGDFTIINRHLVNHLRELGMWNAEMKTRLILADGSIQGFMDLPEEVRAIYKTAYELSMRAVIDQAGDRQAFVCQSQSMNLFMRTPTLAKLTSMHFHSWRKGLKTLQYYLRSAPAATAIKFSEAPAAPAAPADADGPVCTRDNPDCLACSA
jgi:ribonucleoside-diphosphate reductase alpha subunit